jgi:hypothetical protein
VSLLSGLAGCGGSVILGDGGPGGSGQEDATPASTQDSGSSSGSTSPGQTLDVCPPTDPTVGSSCAESGQGCSYLSGGGCRPYVCDGTGHWQTASTGC